MRYQADNPWTPWSITSSSKMVQPDIRCLLMEVCTTTYDLFFKKLSLNLIKYSWKKEKRASLVAQWLRIRMPMQRTWGRALVREDPTCRGATKPVRHNYWACALEPMSHSYWARAPQLLKPKCLEPVLLNKRSHHNEKPAHRNGE